MTCCECGSQQDAWHHVMLCDRCLCARLWIELEADDYVIVRRKKGSDRVWLSSSDGRGTDLSFFKLAVDDETAKRVREIFA